MNPLSRFLFPAAILSACALTPACTNNSPDEDSSCNGGKCDELEGDDVPLDSPCDQALFDRSGRGFLPKRLEDDALIKHVYMDASDGCPVDMAQIMEVLNKNDDAGCSGTNGLTTHVVSETARLNGTSSGASFRTITSRTCDGRKDFGLLFSAFGFADFPGAGGLAPDGDAFPGGLEVIAFDEKNQVFNFYKEVGGKMGFFGSSTDFVTKGPGGPGLTDERGCANCHPHGGLVMKEMENPWLNWEEIPSAGFTTFDRPTPGAAELVESRKDVMGDRGDGPRLEQAIIKPGNAAWNVRRIEFVNANMGVKDLLKPLFCPTDLQIGATFNKRRVNHNYLLDPGLMEELGLDAGGRVNTDEADYDALMELAESEVAGTDATDVHQPMAFVARGVIDRQYVAQLIEAGIIESGFAQDVLMVDFTRQAMSNDRCDLLEFAPDLVVDERTPEAIRDGFLANLAGEADGSPGAQLREHLQARVDGEAFDHLATTEAFLDACSDRQRNDQFASVNPEHDSLLGASEFHLDALKLRSLGRKIAMEDGVLDTSRGSAERRFSVFEFPDGMPFDNIDVVSSGFDPAEPLEVHRRGRFSPIDCSLTDEFTAAGERSGGGGGGSGGGVCPGECGEFVNGASCQCDDQCADFGNCCDGFEDVAAACPGDPGEFVPGASCQCDDQCADFGNCCDGFEAMCS